MVQIFRPLEEDPTLRAGSLTVISGSMFSGKTEELIRLSRRALYARRRVQVFKHALETRSEHDEIRSHNGVPHEAVPVGSSAELLERVDPTTDVVSVEEAQFFDAGIVETCRQLADGGYEVIVAGLDMDFLGKPFGPMPALMAVAEYVTKVHAVCVCCGEIASYSFRVAASDDKILLGETDAYEARCRPCFLEGRQEKAAIDTSSAHKH